MPRCTNPNCRYTFPGEGADACPGCGEKLETKNRKKYRTLPEKETFLLEKFYQGLKLKKPKNYPQLSLL